MSSTRRNPINDMGNKTQQVARFNFISKLRKGKELITFHHCVTFIFVKRVELDCYISISCVTSPCAPIFCIIGSLL